MITLSLPCIIFAGGKSQRLRIHQQPKWALPFTGDRCLLHHTIERLSQQASTSDASSRSLFISAPFDTIENQDTINRLREFGLPLIHDSLADFQGPLAALMSCLAWANAYGHPWIATAACDTPFFPAHLFAELWHKKPESAKACVPCFEGRLHPVFGIWSSALYDDLKQWVIKERKRGLVAWATAKAHAVEFSPLDKPQGLKDPFFNINTPEDYQLALQHGRDC